jgi:formiminotetrahydrofolate cyclodeaminase
MGLRDATLAGFLRDLAARAAAPGGGATAALHAAQAAALIVMVARFSDGPRYDVSVVSGVLAAAEPLVDEAVALGEADGVAFGKVTDAYQLPRGTDAEKAARSAAIAVALGGAARPQADLVLLSRRLAGLAADLLPAANRNLIGDLLAAAASVQAAAEIARVNIETSLPVIRGADPALCAELSGVVAEAEAAADQAGRVVAAIRSQVAS